MKNYNKILFATTNKNKLFEAEKILGILGYEILSLNDFAKIKEPIEDGNSFSENSIIKAKYYYDAFKIPCLTDDSGLEVIALNNEPGIYSARYASCKNAENQDFLNTQKLLKKMENIDDRRAHFACSITYYDGENLLNRTAYLEGNISKEISGENGFGYDPIFIPDGYNVTLSTLTNEEKNNISHRSKALKMICDAIFDKNKFVQ